MNKDKAIILCGMPGAGKGEQSGRLTKELNFVYISTGNLFRSLDKNTQLGKKVHDLMHAGILVDDDTVNEMVETEIKHGHNLVFDGYPRSISQAKWLLKKLEAGNFDVIAILLEITEETAIARRDNRIAETIAAGEKPRKDDLDPMALPKRFKEYYEKTAPMIEFLRKKLGNNFYSINTDGNTIEYTTSVVADILKVKK